MHAERAGGHAVAAAVADVLLDDDRAELGAEERAGRADVEAGRVRAVLADVGAHQPAQRRPSPSVAGTRSGLLLLDERDVAPGVRAERAGVVVRVARPDEAVLGDEVPLLAGDLAGLAADADRRVGEEADRARARRRSRRQLAHAAARAHARSTRGASAARARPARAAGRAGCRR